MYLITYAGCGFVFYILIIEGGLPRGSSSGFAGIHLSFADMRLSGLFEREVHSSLHVSCQVSHQVTDEAVSLFHLAPLASHQSFFWTMETLAVVLVFQAVCQQPSQTLAKVSGLRVFCLLSHGLCRDHGLVLLTSPHHLRPPQHPASKLSLPALAPAELSKGNQIQYSGFKFGNSQLSVQAFNKSLSMSSGSDIILWMTLSIFS